MIVVGKLQSAMTNDFLFTISRLPHFVRNDISLSTPRLPHFVRSNCDESQEKTSISYAVHLHNVPVFSIVFIIVSIFLIHAVIATLKGFPFERKCK